MRESKIIKEEYFPQNLFKNWNLGSGEMMYEGKVFTGIHKIYYKGGGFKYSTFVNGMLFGFRYTIKTFDNNIYLYNDNYWSFDIFITINLEDSLYLIEYIIGEAYLERLGDKNGKQYVKESLNFKREYLETNKILEDNKNLEEHYNFYNNEGLLDMFQDNFQNLANEETLVAYVYAKQKQKLMDKEIYNPEYDLMPFYVLQNEMREKVITEDKLPKEIKYIAGVDVAYNDIKQKMVGAIVVLDANTLEVVDQAHHFMDITFPYIPGLFSFREIPPLLEAFKSLKIKPDLIVCDGQGIAHPKNVGMATHLGIELDIPTIGCAKKRLVGWYEKDQLEKKRGAIQNLVWEDKKVGYVLRTQTDIKPMFVSIGHKISLETAKEWVLKLTPDYRLPETTRQSDQLVNKLMKEQTELDIFGDEE